MMNEERERQKKLREEELTRIIQHVEEQAQRDLLSARSQNQLTGNVRERLFQEVSQVRIYLNEGRKCLDELLTLREQPHIICVDGSKLNPDLYSEESVLFSNIVYNAFMALGLRSQADSEHTSVVDLLKSKTHQVEANFTLAETYVAMGVCIEEAQKRYQTVIDYGKEVFGGMKKASKEGQEILAGPMIKLAYKVGTSHKRLFDIEYHLLKTIERSIEVYVSKKEKEESKDEHLADDKNPADNGRLNLPYGHIPLEREYPGPILLEFRTRLSTQHPLIREAKSWIVIMQDLNHKSQLKSLEQLEFSHYQFMLYLEDITDLGIGCVFNIYDSSNFNCIVELPVKEHRKICPRADFRDTELAPYFKDTARSGISCIFDDYELMRINCPIASQDEEHKQCPNSLLTPKQFRDMRARAEVVNRYA